MKRYGMVIHAKPDKIEEYKKLHSDVWPDVLRRIKASNIQNYSIYMKDDILFSYFEYNGEDYEADMKKIAADESTQKWWDVCKPLLIPFENRNKDEFWANMEEVFHLD